MFSCKTCCLYHYLYGDITSTDDDYITVEDVDYMDGGLFDMDNYRIGEQRIIPFYAWVLRGTESVIFQQCGGGDGGLVLL